LLYQVGRGFPPNSFSRLTKFTQAIASEDAVREAVCDEPYSHSQIASAFTVGGLETLLPYFYVFMAFSRKGLPRAFHHSFNDVAWKPGTIGYAGYLLNCFASC